MRIVSEVGSNCYFIPDPDHCHRITFINTWSEYDVTPGIQRSVLVQWGLGVQILESLELIGYLIVRRKILFVHSMKLRCK